MTFRTLILIAATVFCLQSQAEELKENNTYRTRTQMDVSDDGVNYNLAVGAQSKFVVIDGSDPTRYAIKFLNVYGLLTLKQKSDTELQQATAQKYEKKFDRKFEQTNVTEDKIYFISKTAVNGVPVEKKVLKSFGGVVSGPLVVPFKYRLDDKSLEGDATVGYYAGWGFDTNFWNASETYVTFTPFLSIGLTQVSVSSVDENGESVDDNKSGFSWATGLLVKNWDSMNIGIVYGEDRIGDSQWVHEGEGWISLSVGWEL